MIKFFRRIRFDLIGKNLPTSEGTAKQGGKTGTLVEASAKAGKPASRTGRYLKYAIGEIFLVVIGILIALQLNIWNQARIEKNQGMEVVAKLHADFKENKEHLKDFIISNKDEMTAQIELMNLIGASKEELAQHNLDSLFYVSFGANELAFADNTLKNIMQGGQLNLLKDDEINVLLYKWNTLAEIRKNRMDKLDNWANDKFIPFLLSRISFKEMDVTANMIWSGKSKVKPDYYPLFQEIEFENYLDNSLWFHQQILERCDDTDMLIDEIISATKQ